MAESVAAMHIIVQLVVESAEIPPAFIPRRSQGQAFYIEVRSRRRRGWLPVRFRLLWPGFRRKLRCGAGAGIEEQRGDEEDQESERRFITGPCRDAAATAAPFACRTLRRR